MRDTDVITRTFPTYTLGGWILSELCPEPGEAAFVARLGDDDPRRPGALSRLRRLLSPGR